MPLQATSGAASYDAFGGGVPVVPNYIEEVFSTWLYTGNNTTLPIVNGIDLSTKGGMFWTKSRTNVTNQAIYDTTRGVNFVLRTNSTIASTDVTGDLTSFNTDGYTIGTPTATNDLNFNSNGQFVSWTFRKQPKFFDIVTFTYDGSTPQTISHNLGSVPGCIVVKKTTGTSSWFIYHRSLPTPTDNYLFFDTSAISTFAGIWGTGPTSTDFQIKGMTTGETYVAYLFAHNAGGFGLTGTDNVISCGSYTGNGSASGPTISLGYEPQWLMVKRATGGTGNWVMIDSMRGFVNSTTATPSDAYLVANTSAAESTWGAFTGSENAAIPLATGFQIVTSTAALNNSSNTYIYIAIRRGPMKVPTSGTSVFSPVARTGTGATANVTGVGFAPDFLISKNRTSSFQGLVVDKLRGSSQRIMPDATNAEDSQPDAVTAFLMDGISVGTDGTGAVNVCVAVS